MSVIEASSIGVRTMADGTLRLTVDIEPRHAQDAFRLFGAPGVPIALAALKTAKSEPQREDKPKGGLLSQWAAMRCSEVMFQRWVAETFPAVWEKWLDKSARSVAPKIDPTIVAANVVRDVCGIESRAELDSDDAAAERFHKLIRGPWSKLCRLRSDAAAPDL